MTLVLTGFVKSFAYMQFSPLRGAVTQRAACTSARCCRSRRQLSLFSDLESFDVFGSSHGRDQTRPFLVSTKSGEVQIASFLFVELNGVRMTATEVDAAASFLALAAGELSEADLAKWFKANSRVKTIRR